jgi:hypothetical protein
MAGHVFIIRGDLTKLFCDTWLMPTDHWLDVQPHWLRDIPGLERKWKPTECSKEWTDKKTRVMEICNWPHKAPRPWLVNTGTRGKPAQWYADGVAEYFKVVGPEVKKKLAFVAGRAKPLVGVPLIGTGAGGAWEWRGEILSCLLPRLYSLAEEYDLDIAFTLHSGPDYAAAIKLRNDLARESGLKVWPGELRDELRSQAEALADRARKGELVLFVGAGVSAGAGLPGWKDLILQLAQRAEVFHRGGQTDERMLNEFKNLDVVDQARLIADSLIGIDSKDCATGKKRTIGDYVVDILNEHHFYSLSHAILAALPVNEVVTTNYDSLFETAATYAQGTKPRILPYSPAEAGNRWLLKLHGCVSSPEDIVLTRSDYLRYDEKRAALKGIVQAMLITRHMLFVGFSLTDDNFHRIIEDVRKMVRGDQSSQTESRNKSFPFGTALEPTSNYFNERLWEKDLNWVSFGPPETTAHNRRMLEIFLDYTASHSVSCTNHLLDSRYDGVLTEEEKAFRNAIEVMIAGLTPKAKGTAAWQEVKNLIQRFGGKA